MLVLSRKPGESIVINGPCVIQVTALHSGHVRLGVLADRATSIARTELLLVAPGRRGLGLGLLQLWERLAAHSRAAPIEVAPPAETPAA